MPRTQTPGNPSQDAPGQSEGSGSALAFRVQPVLSAWLTAAEELREHTSQSDAVFWASQVGGCPFAQMLRARGVEALREVPEKVRRQGKAGEIFEQWALGIFDQLGLLIDSQVHLYVPQWRLSGKVDAIVGGPIPKEAPDPVSEAVLKALRASYGDCLPTLGVEVKSRHAGAFWHGKKKGGQVATDPQLMQVAAYALMADVLIGAPQVDSWEVLSISRDDVSLHEDGVSGGLLAQTKERIGMLNNHYEAGSWPECTCASMYGGKGQQYCAYNDGGDTCCHFSLTGRAA